MLNEAKKKDVSVTDAEVAEQGDKMIKSYQGRPGAPATMEAMFAAHPLGAERARADFRESVLINKFVEQEIGSKVKVDPEELKKQYNEIVSNVTESAKAPRPEMVRASHILVKTGEGKTDEAAKKEIDALYAQVKDLKGDALKTKFAELAKEKSDCPSKDKGGDLGAFRHGQMVPEFDKAAFAQEVGKVYEAILVRLAPDPRVGEDSRQGADGCGSREARRRAEAEDRGRRADDEEPADAAEVPGVPPEPSQDERTHAACAPEAGRQAEAGAEDRVEAR